MLFLLALWPRPVNPRNIPASHIVNNLSLRAKMAQAEQWLKTYGPYQNLLQSIQGLLRSPHTGLMIHLISLYLRWPEQMHSGW